MPEAACDSKGPNRQGARQTRATNGWHKYKIAQASHQAKGGAGRKAFKNMMPAKLHMELLKEALRLNKL